MSLRGDNGGLQRNRWPDRAHGRRGTYDLRRNNPRPCPKPPPNTPRCVAAVAFLSMRRLFTWIVMRHRVVTIPQACNAGLHKRWARARMHRHSYGCRRTDGARKKREGEGRGATRRSGRKARGSVARDFCGCVCRCMTPVLPAACHRLFPPLPNTLMLLPILTRRFLTASRNCAAIFRGKRRGRRRIGRGGGGREGGSFNEAGVVHTMLR